MPFTFVMARILIVLLMVSLLAGIGLGFANIGPLHPLWSVTAHIIDWLRHETGRRLG